MDLPVTGEARGGFCTDSLSETSVHGRGFTVAKGRVRNQPSRISPSLPLLPITFGGQVPQEGATLLYGLGVVGRTWGALESDRESLSLTL